MTTRDDTGAFSNGQVRFDGRRLWGLLEDADYTPCVVVNASGRPCVGTVLPDLNPIALGADLAAVAVGALANDEETDDPLETAYQTVASIADLMSTARVTTNGLVWWPTLYLGEETERVEPQHG